MPLVLADRVQETTSTTGTGTLTLTGAVTGYQTFSAIGDGNTTYYTILSGTDWEVGVGMYTASGTTFSRDTVLASSAGGTTKISVTSGAFVWCDYPAKRAVYGPVDPTSVAIGLGAANDTQGIDAIAIGRSAGNEGQGNNAIAIGYAAGESAQTANSIAINASGAALDTANAGLYVDPIRNDTGSTTNALYYNTTSKELTYAPSGGGGGSAGGFTGQIQYNNAGAFAGATHVVIDNDDLTLLENLSPVTPPANTVKLIGRDISGRTLPAYIGPSGLDSALQPLLGRNKVGYWSGIAGTTTNVGVGIALTATGTATAATWAATNLNTSMNRLSFRAATAATTAVSGFRGGASNYWRGNATGLGGFTSIIRFSTGIYALQTSNRCFVGLRSSTTAPTDVAPNTLTNALGCGWDSSDTTIQIYACGTANSKINTGITVIRTTSNPQVFELAMFCPPNDTFVNFTVTDLSSGTSFSTTVTTATPTNLPTNTTALNLYGYNSAGGTSSSVSIELMGIYMETDY